MTPQRKLNSLSAYGPNLHMCDYDDVYQLTLNISEYLWRISKEGKVIKKTNNAD